MGTQERIESLKQRKEKIEQALANLEAREKAKQRKEETRLKILIGGAILSKAKANPKIFDIVQEIVTRAVLSERDRELLARYGWMSPAKTDGDAGGKTAGQ